MNNKFKIRTLLFGYMLMLSALAMSQQTATTDANGVKATGSAHPAPVQHSTARVTHVNPAEVDANGIKINRAVRPAAGQQQGTATVTRVKPAEVDANGVPLAKPASKK
jgi:hypothetical protein